LTSRLPQTRGGEFVPPAERVLIAAARNGRGEKLCETDRFRVFPEREMLAQDWAVAAALEDIWHIVRNSTKAVEIGLVRQARRRHDARSVFVADQVSRMLARRFGRPFDALAADITNALLGLDGKAAIGRAVSRWCRWERGEVARGVVHEPRDWMGPFASPPRRVASINCAAG
jgi:hypothetical protein